jgi:hypothetical protein
MMRPLVLALLSVTLCATGCRYYGDLDADCVLVKRAPDGDDEGYRSVPIFEREIPDNNMDFISFGATECEDFICVRDASFVRPADATDNTPAVGYCSRPCVATSALGCPAENASHDKDPALRLTCRALLLDAHTLAAIKESDPELYNRYFGENNSEYFCARGK